MGGCKGCRGCRSGATAGWRVHAAGGLSGNSGLAAANAGCAHTCGWEAVAARRCSGQRLPKAGPSTGAPPLRSAVEAYIAKAAALASDFASLSELRRGLRARMLQARQGRGGGEGGGWGGTAWDTAGRCMQPLHAPAAGRLMRAHCTVHATLPFVPYAALQSPLCDAPGFVARLEDTYRSLWRRWLDRQQQQQRERVQLPGPAAQQQQAAGHMAARHSPSAAEQQHPAASAGQL